MKCVAFFLLTLFLSCFFVPVTASMEDTVSDMPAVDSPLPRTYHATVVFDNRIWVIGGRDRAGAYKNDVWYSFDGIHWTCANTSAGFTKSNDMKAVVYNDIIWLVVDPFTSDFSKTKNEVWSSADGKSWTLETDTPDFSKRNMFTLLNYDNRLWITGGNPGYKNDVWYSSNGINWTCANASAAFHGRDGHTAFVYDNKMWIVGGMIGDCLQYSSDIWYSSDGKIWYQAASSAAFGDYDFFTSLVYDNQIWIFRGDSLWRSTNGTGWAFMSDVPDLGHAYMSQNKIVYNDEMWVISGNSYGLGDDVWHSSDGITWTRADNQRRIWPRTKHSATVFNDRIWLSGGQSREDIAWHNDIWNSPDGINWYQGSAPFTPLKGHSAVVFNNSLWVIGGTGNNGSVSDVWKSVDGKKWAKVNISGKLEPREGHAAVVFDKKIWVIGGSAGRIRNSEDGIIWKSIGEIGLPLAAWRQAAVVFDDRLWIIGGNFRTDNGQEYYRYESWFTPDGKIWTKANESLPFEIRSPQSVVVYGGHIWMINGEDGVWNSADGYIWNRIGGLPATPQFRDPAILVYHDLIWAIGGDKREYRNDAWYSADGITWKRAPDSYARISLDEVAANPALGSDFSVICDPYCYPGVKPFWVKIPAQNITEIQLQINPVSEQGDTTDCGCG